MACSTLARAKCTFTSAAAARPKAVRMQRLAVRASTRPQLPAVDVQQLSKLVKPTAVAVIANVIAAMPAAADAGKLFDFNLTLPIMASEFLLLMVFLEKFWFTPVGKVLDDRDAEIRNNLNAVKGNSGELTALTAEAESIIREARKEVTALIFSQKTAKQAELDKIYYDAKDRVNKEVEGALAAVEKETQGLFKSLDAQVESITGEVLKRVLPDGVKV